MGRLRLLAEKLKQVTPEKFEGDLLSIIKANEAAIVDINIMQMDQGETAQGSRIVPEYSPVTVEIKRLKGQQFNWVTLEDERDFKNSMFMNAERFPLMFNSTDWKSEMLNDKYGDIFGIARKNIPQVGSEIRPEVKQYCKKLFSV